MTPDSPTPQAQCDPATAAIILMKMNEAASEHYDIMKAVPMNCMGYGLAMHDLEHIIGDMFPALKP